MAQKTAEKEIVIGIVVKDLREYLKRWHREWDEKWEKEGVHFFTVSFLVLDKEIKEHLQNLKSAGRIILLSSGDINNDLRIATKLREVAGVKVYLNPERLRDGQKLVMRRLGFLIFKQDSLSKKVIDYLRDPREEG
jgi:hypothetical protein